MTLRSFSYFAISFAFLVISNSPTFAAEREIAEEIEQLKIELKDAQLEAKKYTKGLILYQILAREQILKTTISILEQRHIPQKHGIKNQSPASSNEIKQTLENLTGEIASVEAELEIANEEAGRYRGGLLLLMKLTNIATLEINRTVLRQKFLASKFGLLLPDVKFVQKEAAKDKKIGNIVNDDEAL